MHFNITDQVISDFLSGIIAVLALIAVGGALSVLLRGLAKKFPFIRLALILALSPLSLIKFLAHNESYALHLYAMVVIVLGVAIDGISHLLLPREQPQSTDCPEKQEEETTEDSSTLVWEKAE
ncbi:MAG: hypothetical protein ABFR47_04505 [Verrucomicrobiota bacterium]